MTAPALLLGVINIGIVAATWLLVGVVIVWLVKWLFEKDVPPDVRKFYLILVALNLDPFETHHGGVFLPPGELGIRDDEVYEVEDLLSGAVYSWYGRHNWVRLDPQVQPAHILRVRRLERAVGSSGMTTGSTTAC